MQRTLIVLGLLLLTLGLLWPWLGWLRLGHLPGDIVVTRPGFTFYVPVTTALLVSLALSLLMWLVGR